MEGKKGRGGTAAQSLLSIMMRPNEGMGSYGLLSGFISLEHNEKEAAHEPQCERLNNDSPSSSTGPWDFLELIIAE